MPSTAVDAIKMSDIESVDKAGIDKQQLAQQVPDAFQPLTSHTHFPLSTSRDPPLTPHFSLPASSPWQVADAFLAQILKTSYFHCDPHPGNLQCDAQVSHLSTSPRLRLSTSGRSTLLAALIP